MGFSRSCPSSLDLLKLVLRGCRGAAGELVLSDPGLAQLGSSLAQARFLEIWNSGDLEIQKFGIQKIKKKNLKIQIRSAQNVGKVWISKKKNLLAPFGAIPGHFLHGPEKSENKKNAKKLPIFLGGPMGPIHPVWGHVLVSFSAAGVKLLAQSWKMRDNPQRQNLDSAAHRSKCSLRRI